MRLEKAFVVFRKDWREIRRNWQIILPMVILPLLFSVVLPILFLLIPTIVPQPTSPIGGLQGLIKNLPNSIRSELAGMTDVQIVLYIVVLYFFAPLFLIIPLMTSTVIASDSFAGEKERRTIEALLATPLTDSELLLGKILVSFIPSMVITIVSFVLYSTVVDVLSVGIVGGRLLLPNISWILLVFGLSPCVALAGIGLTVMISAKVKGFREAQQIGGSLVIPVIALIFAQISGAIIFGPVVIGELIAGLVVVDVAVFRVGVRLFGREEFLSRLA